ncbi:MAG: tetratricopeptide repeat protein [Candidatus Marinimicrobia bacterium]|nr:tetratricopeptide repeat protein [Candidatus Neomarinimicrobiota bacterium]MCF7850539.1 tetratricopeptide repeat protein [Candidatus Neomarinimicrobiota bacterium]MCF7904113.1 tetratricopeptide repeat protein [Candidatus Neomarinimicrobiota bacterium]
MKKLTIVALILTALIGQAIAQNPEVLVAKAREAIKRFDIQAADEAYKAAMKAAIDEDEYKEIETEWQVLEKINIHLRDARRAMDGADYNEALAKYEEALKMIEASPNDIWGKFQAEAYYSMGMVHYRQEKPIQAADEFRNAMGYDPKEDKYGKAIEMVRNKHYSEGHKFYKRRDFRSARAEYEKAVAVDPSFASGFYQLALIAKREGNYDASEKYYRDAVTSDPTHYKSWYGLGSLYAQLGNNAKAIESLKMSISINPSYEKSYYVLAKVYESQKNSSLASQNLKKAIEVDKSYTMAYELLANIYNDQENFSATVSLLKGLAPNVTSYKTNYYLAHAYNGTSNYSAALTAATQSLAKKRNWAPALVEKGDALKGLKRNKDAVIAYRQAARDARWKSVAQYRIDELTKWEGK